MSKIKVTRRTYLIGIDFLIALAAYLSVIAIGAIFGEGYQGIYAYALSFAVFALCVFVPADYCKVVSLRSARGKIHFIRIASNQSRNRLARFFYHSASRDACRVNG